MNPYFTVNDSEHFTFYRIPKLLFTDEIYQTVSTDAKMLYGLLLDRLSLSEKNDWKDEHGRVYQYFTIHQAQELLHFGHEKVCRLFAELDAADLIRVVALGVEAVKDGYEAAAQRGENNVGIAPDLHKITAQPR